MGGGRGAVLWQVRSIEGLERMRGVVEGLWREGRVRAGSAMDEILSKC